MSVQKEFPIKVRRVAVTNKKTGVKYIEERRYQYDPAKGYNVILSSRRTGEKNPGRRYVNGPLSA